MTKLRFLLLGIAWMALATVNCAAARPGSGSPLETVAQVELERYAGRWFEIARLPNRFQDDCARNTTADYSLREDGRVSVINSCTTSEGRDKTAPGVARIIDTASRAKLKVRFAPAFLSFIPAVWGDYWIIDLAPDYSHAVIGEPERRYLWILSRSPRLPEDTLRQILERVEAQGYDVDGLLFTEQVR